MTALKTITALVIAAFAVAGCGERPPEKKATQVVAKVNNSEISVHQINFVLQRTPNIGPAQAEAAKKQVLEGLIDQELAVQQAQDGKLERTPEVMQAIEAARRDILARAYLEQAAGTKTKPAAEDVRKYYADHPELFASRKIYRLEEVSFAVTPEALASVKEQLAKGKTTAEVVTALKAAGVEVGGGVVVKPAEQLSLELLPRLAAARDGQPQLVEYPGRASIITVLASKSEPIDEIKATPVIEAYLINMQKAEQSRDAIKQLRTKAIIEYVGEFAGIKPAAAAEQPVAKTQDAAINKGIAGLK